MQSRQIPCRRWTGSWVAITLWVGLVPVLIAAGYYAIKNPDDFDPSLKPLRADSLMWSVRVGSTSNSRRTIGVGSTTFGVNAYNEDFDAGCSQVWNGALHATYQATYLAWFRGAHSPTVFTAFRNVKPNGETIYGVRQNGAAPLIRNIGGGDSGAGLWYKAKQRWQHQQRFLERGKRKAIKALIPPPLHSLAEPAARKACTDLCVEMIGEIVPRDGRWTTAGATPARELVRSTAAPIVAGPS
jgi:hypothetical protein